MNTPEERDRNVSNKTCLSERKQKRKEHWFLKRREGLAGKVGYYYKCEGD